MSEQKPTRIQIESTPNAESDDLDWIVVDDNTGTVYESVDEQPADVTDAEYHGRQLVRDGVEWWRIEEDFGEVAEWWREAGRASASDSWRNALVDELHRRFAAEGDDGRDMYPDLPVGTYLEVHDDYWGDGEWTIFDLELRPERYLVCNRLLDPETTEHCEFDGDVVVDPTRTTRCPACSGPLVHRAPREKGRSCRECGCTDDRACTPPCWWVEQDLCSTCRYGAPDA